MELMSRKCKGADALAETNHYHHHARGNYRDGSGRVQKLATFTGRYTEAEGRCYAATVKELCRTTLVRNDYRQGDKRTVLMQMAERSDWYKKFKGKPPLAILDSMSDQEGGQGKKKNGSEAGSSGKATRGTAPGGPPTTPWARALGVCCSGEPPDTDQTNKAINTS